MLCSWLATSEVDMTTAYAIQHVPVDAATMQKMKTKPLMKYCSHLLFCTQCAIRTVAMLAVHLKVSCSMELVQCIDTKQCHKNC